MPLIGSAGRATTTRRLSQVKLLNSVGASAVCKGDEVMLVTFTCPAYADITMFGPVAIQLLKLMGHSGTVPGAILAEDVAAALERLKTGLDKAAELPQPAAPSEDDEDEEPRVSLRHRALPLLELLTAAAEAECNVMWDQNH